MATEKNHFIEMVLLVTNRILWLRNRIATTEIPGDWDKVIEFKHLHVFKV